MTHNCIIVRYGEIALKGQNRKLFEKKLVSNIKLFFKKYNTQYLSIDRVQGRIIISTNKDGNFLKYVFGITSFSHAVKVKPDTAMIEKTCLKIAQPKLNKTKTFKVDTNRINKTFGLSSLELNSRIGESIRNKTRAMVKLKNPELTIGIEIIDYAYIFIDKIAGVGGLPVGVEGNAYALVENKADILAGVLAMKRGCSITPIAHKQIDLILLKKFGPSLELEIIRDINCIDKDKALVVGQNLECFKELQHPVVLMPLVSYTAKEIASAFGSYLAL